MGLLRERGNHWSPGSGPSASGSSTTTVQGLGFRILRGLRVLRVFGAFGSEVS